MACDSSFSDLEVSELLYLATRRLHPKFGILPRELSDQIVSYLSKGDIWTLARIRKSCSNAIMPFIRTTMYKCVSFNITLPKHEYPGHLHCLATSRIQLFLRTLLLRPELASNVLRFSIEVPVIDNRRFSFRCVRVPTLPECDLKMIEGLRTDFCADKESRNLWIQRLKEGYVDEVLAPILSSLKNIRYLKLPHILHYRDGYMGAVLERYAHSLEHLTHIDFDGKFEGHHRFTDFQDQVELGHFLPLFRIPNLDHATLTLPRPSHKKYSWETIPCPTPAPPAAVSLKTLILNQTELPELVLGQILGLCPSLTSLTYEYDNIEGRFEINPTDLGDALRHVSSTLEWLEIRVCIEPRSATDVGHIGRESFVGAIGSLSFMTRLRHLEIAPVILYGWETEFVSVSPLLPSGLQTLCLRDDLEFMAHPILEVVCTQFLMGFLEHSDWRGICPQLRSVDVKLGNYNDWEQGVCLIGGDLRRICQETGLSGQLSVVTP